LYYSHDILGDLDKIPSAQFFRNWACLKYLHVWAAQYRMTNATTYLIDRFSGDRPGGLSGLKIAKLVGRNNYDGLYKQYIKTKTDLRLNALMIDRKDRYKNAKAAGMGDESFWINLDDKIIDMTLQTLDSNIKQDASIYNDLEALYNGKG